MDETARAEQPLRLYDGEGDLLLEEDVRADRIILLPSGNPRQAVPAPDRIRIMWGHHLLADLVSGRYRTIVCGVNDIDNSHGILGELLELVPTSQWTVKTATSYARVFHESVHLHHADDREPYVLKFDLDRLLILGILRPRGQDHFKLQDLARGFRTAAKMLDGRWDRRPVASVCFLGAKSNRLIGPDGLEPTFETVLRTMWEAGFRSDVYPCWQMWAMAPTGVFCSYPFPESLDTMRRGGF